MSVELHSFGWLLRHHPNAAASILAANDGDQAAAAENWQDLQEQIHERARQTVVMLERKRALEHIEMASLAGCPELAGEGYSSGQTAEEMRDFYVQQATQHAPPVKDPTLGTCVRPLALALTSAALARRPALPS